MRNVKITIITTTKAMKMSLPTSDNMYTIYYDESNNVRKLHLTGEKFNVDNDPNQKSTPNFIIAGVALSNKSTQINSSELKGLLQLQNQENELKFAQMVKIKAKHNPTEALTFALRSKRFNTLFKYLHSHNVLIQYFALNTVHWAFLDIVEDMVYCTGDMYDIANQFHYKDSLYKLIQLEKASFLSLMTKFNYPNIEKENSLSFLTEFKELLITTYDGLPKDSDSEEAREMLARLDFLLNKCITVHSENIEMGLVYSPEKNILINDFSMFYINRLKMFPSSTHFLDNEFEIEQKIELQCKTDNVLNKIDFSFVDSKDPQSFLIQISDVISGFVRLYFDFLEYIPVADVNPFIDNLDSNEKDTLLSFKTLIDSTVEECGLLVFRTSTPLAEHKASILHNSLDEMNATTAID